MTRSLPSRPRPFANPAPLSPARGALGLVLLAALAALAMRLQGGDSLGLLVGVAGSLAVALAVPQPERQPFLALGWSALAFALPLALVLTRPGFGPGLALALGTAGFWALLTQTTARRLPPV